jgi:peptide deformylase
VSEEKRIIIDGGRLGGKALAIAAGAALSKARTESDRPIIVYDEEDTAPAPPEATIGRRSPHEFLGELARVPQLRLWGEPILEYPGDRLTDEDFAGEARKDLDRLVADLKARLAALPHGQKGFGLAAPQIGVSRAVAYVKCPEQVTKAKAVLHEFVMVNPAIVRKGKKIRVMEGCLSIPHFFHTIERRHDLTVVYKDETGVVRSLNAKGRLAQVIQHEVDHLLGTLMVNHVKERQGRRLAEREIRRYRK